MAEPLSEQELAEFREHYEQPNMDGALRSDFMRLLATIDALRQRLAALEPYVQHKPGCPAKNIKQLAADDPSAEWPTYRDACTCGLDAIGPPGVTP